MTPWVPSAMMNQMFSSGTPAACSSAMTARAMGSHGVGRVMSSMMMTALFFPAAPSLMGLVPMAAWSFLRICASVSAGVS